MYDDFAYRGRHCTELGVHAFWGESGAVGAKLVRNLYDLPGGVQTEIGETAYAAWTRRLTLAPVSGREMDAAMVRAVLGWLCGGTGCLIADDDPERMWAARFDGGATLDNRSWPDGCLQIGATMLGTAMGVRLQRFTASTADGKALIRTQLDSQLPAPLDVTIACTSGTITSAAITCGARTLELDGLGLTAGQTLRYSAGTQAEAPELRVGGVLDFSAARRWQRLMLWPRCASVRITLAGGEADVAASARGRYLA